MIHGAILLLLYFKMTCLCDIHYHRNLTESQYKTYGANQLF